MSDDLNDHDRSNLEALVAKLKELLELGLFTTRQEDAGYSRFFNQAADVSAMPVTVIDMDHLSPELKALVIAYFKDKHDRAKAAEKLMELLPFIKFDIEALERGAFPAGNA